MKVRATLLFAAAAVLINEGRGQYSTGFESPSFISGEIAGQDSWTLNQNPGTSRVLTNSEIATELTNAGLTPGQTVPRRRPGASRLRLGFVERDSSNYAGP
jgi:hypothetical protein